MTDQHDPRSAAERERDLATADRIVDALGADDGVGNRETVAAALAAERERVRVADGTRADGWAAAMRKAARILRGASGRAFTFLDVAAELDSLQHDVDAQDDSEATANSIKARLVGTPPPPVRTPEAERAAGYAACQADVVAWLWNRSLLDRESAKHIERGEHVGAAQRAKGGG